jgi:hypothetical protein
MQHITILWGERDWCFMSEIRLDLSSVPIRDWVTLCNNTSECLTRKHKAAVNVKLLKKECAFRAVAENWTRKRERGELRAEDFSNAFKENFSKILGRRPHDGGSKRAEDLRAVFSSKRNNRIDF